MDPPLEELDDEQQQDTSDPTWDPSLPGKPLFLDFDPIIFPLLAFGASIMLAYA